MKKKVFKIIDLLSSFIVFEEIGFENFLRKTIATIGKIIKVDSCLIYFYDRREEKLILVGSKKPHKNLLGKITLKKGEGITGWAAQHKKIVVIERQAYEDSRFKFFRQLPEDRYEAFLSVPIFNNEGVVGVINLQNRLPYKFKKEEIEMVVLFTKIIASAFKKLSLKREVEYYKEKLEERKLVEKAKGLLMKRQGLTEEEAYQKIQKEAMKKRKKMREIAEAVILVYG